MKNCPNCRHYVHRNKQCRLDECSYLPFEDIEIPPSEAEPSDVRSRW